MVEYLAQNKEEKQQLVNVLKGENIELEDSINKTKSEVPYSIEKMSDWEIDVLYYIKFNNNYTIIKIIVDKAIDIYFLLSTDGTLDLIIYQRFRPVQNCVLSEGMITGRYFMGFGECGFLKTFYPKPEFLKSGYVIHHDFKYDEIYPFNEGLAVVKKDQKYGFINENNKTVIPFNYDFALSFSEGLAPVARNGKMGFINKNNVNIVPFCFDLAQKFHNGCALVCLTSYSNGQHLNTDKWAIINKEGKILVM